MSLTGRNSEDASTGASATPLRVGDPSDNYMAPPPASRLGPGVAAASPLPDLARRVGARGGARWAAAAEIRQPCEAAAGPHDSGPPPRPATYAATSGRVHRL